MISQRTKQHICKLLKLIHNQSLLKSCFLADLDKTPKLTTYRRSKLTTSRRTF
jgi:hypothetical protein